MENKYILNNVLLLCEYVINKKVSVVRVKCKSILKSNII